MRLSHSGSLAVAIAACFATTAAPAHAMGPHHFDVSPKKPRVNEPLTLTADVSYAEVVGTPMFSWDLDGDGVCETAWTANPSISVTFGTVGIHGVNSCAEDDAGMFICFGEVPVYPTGTLPRARYKMKQIPSLTELLRDGATLKVRWNRDTEVRYDIELSMHTRGDPRTEKFPMRKRVKSDGANDVITLRPFDKWRRLRRQHHKAQKQVPMRRRYGTQIFVTTDFSADPVFAPVNNFLRWDTAWYSLFDLE